MRGSSRPLVYAWKTKYRQRTYAGLLSLVKTYNNERLNAACERGLKTGASTFKSIKAILKNNLDQQPTELQLDLLEQLTTHANLRQPHEFH